MQQPLPARSWWAIVLVGLAGQVAWTIENLYLNLFVYETITDSPGAIAAMVAVSAITATTAAFLVGAWSDRVGRRRVFIAVGYVLWGLSTMAFGLVSPENVARLVPFAGAVGAAVVVIIVVDAVMSFLGAGANDAAFNAWVTDTTEVGNRGRVDGVLQVMPLVSMLLVFGALDPMTRAGDWAAFFVLIGAVMVVAGVAAWFLVADAADLVPTEGSSLRAMLASLHPEEVRRNPGLLLSLVTLAVIGISSQVFLPYVLIYVQYTLQIEAYALVLAVVLGGSALVGVLGGRVIDHVGKVRAMLPALGVYVVGLLLMAVARDLVPVIGAGLVVFSGFLVSSAAVNATVRDHTPADRVGAIQGLRMVFFVLVPMVLGPALGAAVISEADQTYEDLGQVKQVPSAGIFVAAAVVAVLAVLPILALRRHGARPGPLPGTGVGTARPGLSAARAPAPATGARRVAEPQRTLAVRDPAR
ncbi:MAG: MFS transporter [Candidatus Nanopelagicales bacterium]|nr:MFS transporter [Candidatus Nanopelagicales bacterium]